MQLKVKDNRISEMQLESEVVSRLSRRASVGPVDRQKVGSFRESRKKGETAKISIRQQLIEVIFN